MPGIRTSTMRHEVSCSWPDLRKASADSKAAARKPKDSMSRVVVLSMDSFLSPIEIRFRVTSNCLRERKVFSDGEGINWALVDRASQKGDAGNAFVYEAFLEGLFSFS